MDTRMAVIREYDDDTNELVEIRLGDVDFIETEKRRIVYYIGNEKYYHITSKTELDMLLSKKGFDSLDRTNIVNLRKIRKFDEKHGKVYFVENPDKNSKSANVARIKYAFIKNLIKRIVAYNNGKTQEVKMGKSGVKSVVNRVFNNS